MSQEQEAEIARLRAELEEERDKVRYLAEAAREAKAMLATYERMDLARQIAARMRWTKRINARLQKEGR